MLKLENTQQETIINYFKRNEKKIKDFKIGAEFEYFVVDKKTLNAIAYEGNNGVLTTLLELLSKGYEGIYEGNHLLGLKKGESTITLEPGCQLEISVKPEADLNALEKEYKSICTDVLMALDKKNQVLMATGYQVQTPINEIVLLPKRRYQYMYDYFKKCGQYAHNMMKQTASTQVSIDYENELDYHKKNRILNSLSPIFYAFFDNAPFFESELYQKHGIRLQIWDACDNNRCGIIKEALTDSFDYSTYANYLLNKEIVFKDDVYLRNTLFKDLYNPSKLSDLEHALSMVFPDIRTKQYLEIRMMDSMPYPLNLAVVALIKGLFYDESNLNELYQLVLKFKQEDILKLKNTIVIKGIETRINEYSIYEMMKYLLTLSYKGLGETEKRFLTPLSNLIQLRMTPQQLTKNQMNLGKEKALEWCMLQQSLFGEDFKWMQAI